EYRPRYYDQQKERKQELERMVNEVRTGQVSDERRSERMRQQIGSKWTARRTTRKGATTGQGVRFLLIAIVLAGLVWLFLNWG
ncbi:MAG: hypothetical protein K9J06_12880, partial [Flavobacteriales bacterium]|nr:hypothetical protein [Flavobacteriales bacterium]